MVGTNSKKATERTVQTMSDKGHYVLDFAKAYTCLLRESKWLERLEREVDNE